jgi:predicted DNA-binding transcriptional regulator YafY
MFIHSRDDIATSSEAYQRGRYDAERGRPRLFRSTRVRGIVATTSSTDADAWSDEARRDYLAGYDSFEGNS